MPGRGRPFAKGNPGGPGRPKRKVEEQYLEVLRDGVPMTKWKKVVEKALEQAIAGDKAAREWIGKYVLPVPQPEAPDPPENFGAMLLALQATLRKPPGG